MVLATLWMRVMDDGSVSVSEVVVSNCGFDDDTMVVGVSGFEESDSVLVPI